MPRPSGAPTDADHTSVTTTASTTMTVDVAGPRDPLGTSQGLADTTGLTIVTSRQPEDVEIYVGTLYEKNRVPQNPTIIENSSCANQNTVPKNPTIIENLSCANLQKMETYSSLPPSSNPPPSDPYHGPDTAATPIATPTLIGFQHRYEMFLYLVSIYTCLTCPNDNFGQHFASSG